MRGELMLPDSISEEKLEIDWKMEDLQAGPFWCRLLICRMAYLVDLPFFNQFLFFLQKWSQATSAHLSLRASYKIQNFSKTRSLYYILQNWWTQLKIFYNLKIKNIAQGWWVSCQNSELRSYASWHHLAHKILGREVFLGAIFPTPTSENIGTLGNEFSFSSVFFGMDIHILSLLYMWYYCTNWGSPHSVVSNWVDSDH